MTIKINKLIIDEATGIGAGTETIKGTGKDLTVQALGTFIGTVALEGSLDDGANWFTIESLTNTTPAFVTGKPVPLLRGNVTGYTSGTISLMIAQME